MRPHASQAMVLPCDVESKARRVMTPQQKAGAFPPDVRVVGKYRMRFSEARSHADETVSRPLVK